MNNSDNKKKMIQINAVWIYNFTLLLVWNRLNWKWWLNDIIAPAIDLLHDQLWIGGNVVNWYF